MRNLFSAEKMLKHWFKKKMTITTATVIGFLLTGTMAFSADANDKVIINDNETRTEGLIFNSGNQVVYVENNGKIEITELAKLQDSSAIRLQEEKGGKRKELVNNGDIDISINEKTSKVINGAKLLGNARIINNGNINVTSLGTSYGINGILTGDSSDDVVIENNGSVKVKGDTISNALFLANRSNKELKVENNGTLELEVTKDLNHRPSVISFINDFDSAEKISNRSVLFNNKGNIKLAGASREGYAIKMQSGTVNNTGIISISSKDKILRTRGIKSEVSLGEEAVQFNSTGIIKITDKSANELKDFDISKLFDLNENSKIDVEGTMLVDKDGVAVGDEDKIITDKYLSNNIINGFKDKAILGDNVSISMEDQDAINIGALEIRGNVTVNGDTPVKIEDTTINLDANGKLTVEAGKELSIKENNINKTEKGSAIILGDKSKLALDGVTVNANIGEGNTGSVEAKNTSINGNISANELNVIGGTEKEVNITTLDGEIAINKITVGKESSSTFRNVPQLPATVDKLNLTSNSKFTKEGTLKINEGGQVSLGIDAKGNNVFKNTKLENGKVSVTGDNNSNTTDLVLETGNISGEKLEVGFGDSVTFDKVNVGTDSEIYTVDKTELGSSDKNVTVSYNTKLYKDNVALNNLNNAVASVNNLFSQEKIERAGQLDKIYSANIYSETVKASYNNIKLNEETILSLARTSEVGKWTAEGKAIYDKSEYDRDGITKDYSSEVESTGLMGALSYGVDETTTAGVAFSGVKQDVDTDGGSADADLFYLGVYGNKVYGNYDFTAGLGYQFGKYEADNTIANLSTSDKYDSKAISGYVQGKYKADLGDGLSVQPKAKLGYTYVDQDNAKDAYFGVSDAKVSTFDVEVGADLVKTVALEKGKMNLLAGVSYTRAMGDTDSKFDGRFYGAKASDRFDVLGAEIAENTVKFNVGAEVEYDNGLFYNGGMTYEFGSDDTKAYGVNVGAGYRF